MGRKKTQPRHLDDDQRRQEDWNMLDGASGQSSQQPDNQGNLIIMQDDDPALELERQAAKKGQDSAKRRTTEPGNGDSLSIPGTSSQSFFESSGLDITMPDNIRRHFARLEVQLQFNELQSNFLHLPVYSAKHCSSKTMLEGWHWIVGKFIVHLDDRDNIPMTSEVLHYLSSFEQCWLYIGEGSAHALYFETLDEEFNKERLDKLEKKDNSKKVSARGSSSSQQKSAAEDPLALFWPVTLAVPEARKFFTKLTRSGQKKFQLVYEEMGGSGKELQVTVYGRKDSLQKLNYASQAFATREMNSFMLMAMDRFYNLGPLCDRGISSLHQDFQELYEGVRMQQALQSVSLPISTDVQHPNLKPVLRPYQQDAVRWMLRQERFGQDAAEQAEGKDDIKVEEAGNLHPLYTEVTTHCGKTLYYNRQGGSLIMDRPKAVTSPPGGVLADEMGLGKTVEVLCCLLLHPRAPIPPPPRLPTLMEVEMEKHQEEENSRDTSILSVSSSVTDLSSVGSFAAKQPQNEESALKRVDSNNGSVSSVPSDVVTFVAGDDHSYQVKESENVDGPAENARPPLKLTLKRLSRENSDKNSEPPAKKQREESEEENQETQEEQKHSSSSDGGEKLPKVQPKKKSRRARITMKKRRKKGSGQPRPQKRKLPELQADKGCSEVEKASKKRKGLEPGKIFFFYVEDNEDNRPSFFNNAILKARKQKFECVCGKGEDELEYGGDVVRAKRRRKPKHVVKCTGCGTSQHAECVHYDLDDPLRGLYKCPHCHSNAELLPSGATLIISPYSIAHQWMAEIQKHIQEKSLKVFEYKGVRYQGYIQPQFLVSQDIVITTYETLRNDLNYVNVKPTNSDEGLVLRQRKKFMAHPTPLTAVEWWRICLDEAQMVESGTTKTAEMALRLSCVNRWCVTGTPLNQSIKDLYGLLAFIGYDPYCVEEWWIRCLYEPYLQGIKQPMFHALAKVMWRNSMKDVRAQLQLPGKSEVIKHLTFSPVEEIFYRRLFQNCSQEIFQSTNNLSEKQKLTKLRKLDHHTVNKYLTPLRKLRQACCHPQAVSGSNLSLKCNLLTMEELLENLIKKTTLECVESHRSMVASMNAQAGIYLIEDPPRVTEAVEMYRAVLRSVQEHEQQKKLKTDSLPHIHALHNLAQVLATKPPGVGYTTRDDQLTAQCEELKTQYRQRASNIAAASREQLLPLSHAVDDLTKQLGAEVHWYQSVLQFAVVSGAEQYLVQRVKGALADMVGGVANKRFRDMAGLQFIIVQDMTELLDSRQPLQKMMKTLGNWTSTMQAIHCCIRPPSGVPQRTCPYCVLEKKFLEWEQQLFSVVVSRRVQAGMDNNLYRGGSWQNSMLENILRVLQSYAKNHLMDEKMLKNAALVMSLFDAWKKEFKQLRSLWAMMKEEAGAADELEMAVTCMRLPLPEEESLEHRDKNICDRVELPALLKKFTSDKKIYEGELKVRCGQLDYLRNLAKGNPGQFTDGINPEECPICRSPLGRNWSVMRCGHCCCLSCIQLLIDRCPEHNRTPDTAVRCMICRDKTKAGDISYISTSRSSEDQFVKGSHSTKVKAIVRCLFNIQKADPEAKALVFATWVDVLKVIGKALDENFISYTQLYDHGHHYEKNINKFRTDKTVKVLLLPYSTGSKGLNLFEANHVLLVEPTYSPSEEAQAIGRVYRMGQTRPTKIYRFLVKSTIEERIHSLMESTLRPSADANEANKDAITLAQLISLFEEDDTDVEDLFDSDNETSRDEKHGHAGASLDTGRSASDPAAVAGPSHVPDDDLDSCGEGPSGVSGLKRSSGVVGSPHGGDASPRPGPSQAADRSSFEGTAPRQERDCVSGAGISQGGPEPMPGPSGRGSCCVIEPSWLSGVLRHTASGAGESSAPVGPEHRGPGATVPEEVTAPEGVADVTAPEGVADVTAPEGVADVTAPEGVADVTAPEGVADVTAPEPVADVTTPEPVADVTAPEPVADVTSS